MPKYLIERTVPGAGQMDAAALAAIANKSNEVLRDLGPDVQWLHSYVSDDKITCVYLADQRGHPPRARPLWRLPRRLHPRGTGHHRPCDGGAGPSRWPALTKGEQRHEATYPPNRNRRYFSRFGGRPRGGCPCGIRGARARSGRRARIGQCFSRHDYGYGQLGSGPRRTGGCLDRRCHHSRNPSADSPRVDLAVCVELTLTNMQPQKASAPPTRRLRDKPAKAGFSSAVERSRTRRHENRGASTGIDKVRDRESGCLHGWYNRGAVWSRQHGFRIVVRTTQHRRYANLAKRGHAWSDEVRGSAGMHALMWSLRRGQ